MSKSKDLGTYHLRVKFADGRGYIQKWSTGMRFRNGMDDISPLGAGVITPTWDNEEDLLRTMVFIYTEGNYSCDCNKLIFLAEAAQDCELRDELMDAETCGNTIVLESLVLIRPDAGEIQIFP